MKYNFDEIIERRNSNAMNTDGWRAYIFGAPDDEGTDIFFLINCTDRKLHLHVLARLCLLAHGTTLLADLRAAPDAASMLSVLKAAEDSLLGSLRRC